MTKRSVIAAFLMFLGCGAFAQGGVEGSTSGTNVGTNNNMKVTLRLGNANMYDQSLTYVLPKYSNSATVGIGIGSSDDSKSNNPGQYIQLNDLGNNNILNMAGIEFGYFITGEIEANLSFAMDIRTTPKKDYIEGLTLDGTTKSGSAYGSSTSMAIQPAKYIQGELKNNWMVNVGGNYHFSCSNNRIDFYAGVKAGFQQGRITTYTPYTNQDWNFLNAEGSSTNSMASVILLPREGRGQLKSITAEIVGGIDYALAQGLTLGVEFAPYSYRYSVLEVLPLGGEVYQANHHANRFFASPMMKLGFRF